MNQEIFRNKLYGVLSRDTSALPDTWSADNPTWGHCAIVALIVQELFGGELLRGVLEQGSHYWNLLPDGTEADFTGEQFGENRPNLKGELRTREYVLSYAETKRRYELLKERLLNELP